jgi:predicted nucleic acid-binding protein
MPSTLEESIWKGLGSMPTESVLVDTGALAALFDPSDQYHEACKAESRKLPIGKAFTCWPVITEASYLLRGYPEKRDGLLHAVYDGEFQLLPLGRADISGVPDATLVHLGDREDIDRVFGVDHRHFRVFRRKNGRPFRLLPEVV